MEKEKQNDEIDPVEVMAPTQWILSNNNDITTNETIRRSSTRNKRVPSTGTKDFFMGDSNVIKSNKITNLQFLMDESELTNLQKNNQYTIFKGIK